MLHAQPSHCLPLRAPPGVCSASTRCRPICRPCQQSAAAHQPASGYAVARRASPCCRAAVPRRSRRSPTRGAKLLRDAWRCRHAGRSTPPSKAPPRHVTSTPGVAGCRPLQTRLRPRSNTLPARRVHGRCTRAPHPIPRLPSPPRRQLPRTCSFSEMPRTGPRWMRFIRCCSKEQQAGRVFGTCVPATPPLLQCGATPTRAAACRSSAARLGAWSAQPGERRVLQGRHAAACFASCHCRPPRVRPLQLAAPPASAPPVLLVDYCLCSLHAATTRHSTGEPHPPAPTPAAPTPARPGRSTCCCSTRRCLLACCCCCCNVPLLLPADWLRTVLLAYSNSDSNSAARCENSQW